MNKNATPGVTIKTYSNPEGPMGLSYLRSLACEIDLPPQPEGRFVFPRGASRIECSLVKNSRSEVKITVTSASFLYLPPNQLWRLKTISTITDLFTLTISEKYLNELVSENELPKKAEVELQTIATMLRRSRWLDDLIERYFFERVVNRYTPKGCPFFLEKQMLNEFARLRFPTLLMTTGEMLGEEHLPLLESILRYVDQEIFRDVSIETLCAKFRLSPSSLLRLFKQHFGVTPAAFILRRKLDEAAIMLERGEFPVSDVAFLSGFSDLSSFTRSFKKQFGQSPSDYLRKVD